MLIKSSNPHKFLLSNSRYFSPQSSFLSTSATTTHNNKKSPIINQIHSLKKDLKLLQKPILQHHLIPTVYHKYIKSSSKYENQLVKRDSLKSSLIINKQSRNMYIKTLSKDSAEFCDKNKQILSSSSVKDFIINSSIHKEHSPNNFQKFLNCSYDNNLEFTRKQLETKKINSFIFNDDKYKKKTNKDIIFKGNDVSFYLKKTPLVRNYNARGGNYEQFLFSSKNKLSCSNLIEHLRKTRKKIYNPSILKD